MTQIASSSWMQRLSLYYRLVRFDKPIGILLLVWPTMWALWSAAQGTPHWYLIVAFVLGTALMRAAGCGINDYLDRDVDKFVERTRDRVLTTGQISTKEALGVTAVLVLLAALLIIPMNTLVWKLSVVAVFLAATYPTFKRWFGIPQAYLGIAYGFGIPMGYAAVLETVPFEGWLMLLASIFWTLAYDTEYAMVDRPDDLRLGLKASAVTFGRYDVLIVGICYAVCLLILAYLGQLLGYGWPFNLSLLGAAGIAVVHLWWIRERDRSQCFRAFLHNTWFGFVIFVGVFIETTVKLEWLS
ncbi:MAG: 4-hydroxybenzoate octaprenyltransferase [Pigmentiphaga sp.]